MCWLQGFQNGKSLKDFLVRATLQKLNESGRYEACGKKTCLVCDSTSTAPNFTTESFQETFKIQSGPLKCDYKKVLYLLKCETCGEVSPMIGKRKPNFVVGLMIIKVNIERLEWVIGKFFRNYFTLTIVLMTIAALKIGIL